MEAIRRNIQNMFNLPEGGWIIQDYETVNDNQLYLLHYKDNADMDNVGNIRGSIVDLKRKLYIVPNRSFIKNQVVDRIYTINDETTKIPEYIGYQLDGTEQKIDFNDCSFSPGIEGTTVRAFWYEGQFFISSYKKLDVGSSWWGRSKSFKRVYEDLNGPKPDELFDTSKKFSPYSHIFILAHPTLMNVSKTNVGNGVLVYVGFQKAWDTDKLDNFPPDSCDMEYRSPPNMVQDIDVARQENKIYMPKKLTLEEVNNFLMHGFIDIDKYPTMVGKLYPASLYNPGECVICHVQNSPKNINRTINFQSSSYKYRQEIRRNNPNIRQAFYIYMQETFYTHEEYNMKRLEREYVPYESIIEILENEYIMYWDRPPSRSAVIRDPQYNPWVNFLMSVPLVYQQEAASYYKQYYELPSEISKWLTELYVTGHAINLKRDTKLYGIISEVSNSEDLYKSPLENLILNIIMSKRGVELFKIIREYEKIKDDRQMIEVETMLENMNVDLQAPLFDPYYRTTNEPIRYNIGDIIGKGPVGIH